MSAGSTKPKVITSHSTASPLVPGDRRVVCGKCGAPLAASALGGTCPRCLLRLALEDGPRESIEESPDRAAADEWNGLPRQFGRYSLLRPIGRGAMGAVFLARDAQLNRNVAIKTPLIGRSGDATLVARFRREVQLAAALSHPNICPIHDVGEVNGIAYYTMAFLDGRPLTDWIHGKRTISARQAAQLVRKLAIALAEAHGRGIVHRDLKPSNIMIDRRGEPIIMDFGLARENSHDIRLTRSDAVVGTPAYIAPEQLGGAGDAPATDIYSLGVVLFELLTKRLPFEGPLGEMLAQIARDEPPAPSRFCPDVPPTLETICLRALAKKPADRFPSMLEFAGALATFLKTAAPDEKCSPALAESGAVERSSMADDARTHTGSRREPGYTAVAPYAVAGGVGLALAVGAVVAICLWNGRGANESPSNSKRVAIAQLAPQSPREMRTSSVAESAATGDSSKDDSTAPRTSSPALITAKKPLPTDAATPTADTDSPTTDVEQRVPPSAESPSSIAKAAQPSTPKETPAPESKPLEPKAAEAGAEAEAPTMFERCLAELRRVDDERKKVLQEVAIASVRLNDDLPKLHTKTVGDWAAVTRLGENLASEIKDLEGSMVALQRERTSANNETRLLIDNELKLRNQRRTQMGDRLKGLQLEARGKQAEVARFEKETADLKQTLERLGLKSQQLVDAAFWAAEPSGSLGAPAYGEIAELFSQWLRENRDQAELLALRAIAWANHGKPEDALKDAQRALKLRDKSPFALAALGYAKYRRGHTSDGITEMTRAIRMAPHAPYAFYFRGLANRERKNDTAALDDFAKVVELVPDAPWGHCQLALQRAASRVEKQLDPEQALAHAERACAGTSQRSWLCLESLAAAHAAAGQFDEAIRTQKTAESLAPPELESACHERLSLYQNGQPFRFER